MREKGYIANVQSLPTQNTVKMKPGKQLISTSLNEAVHLILTSLGH